MIKFNVILAFAAITAVSAYNSPIDGFYETGECHDLNVYLNSSNVELYKCEMNNNEKINRIVIGNKGEKISQDVIDHIAQHDKTLESLEFFNIPGPVDLSGFHLPELKLINDNDLPTEYKKYSLPEGILKTAKNVDRIVLGAYPLNQNHIDELSSLTSLKDLTLSSCDFGTADDTLDFSKFENLTKLNALYLSTYYADRSGRGGQIFTGPPFKGFSEGFCKLKNLKEIQLYHGEISSLPFCIGQLSNLEKLVLNYCELTELPKEFGKLTKLKYLNLDSNKITALPDEFVKLTQLNELNLSNNQIKSVSSAIGKFNKLESLVIQSNKIADISSSITSLSNLKKLDLSNNSITTIPDTISDLKKLESLAFSGNSIVVIPEALGQLKNLKYLALNNNKIDCVLPKSLNDLTKLEGIYLFNNVDIRGETLTQPSLQSCDYNVGNNKSENGICVAKNTSCKTFTGIQPC